jgi:hypothetical protein
MGRLLRVLGLALMAVAALAYLGSLYGERGLPQTAAPPGAAGPASAAVINLVIWSAVFLAGAGLAVFGTYAMRYDGRRQADDKRRRRRKRNV